MTTIDQTIEPADQLRADAHDAGWFTDPEAVHHLRYHDGLRWTDHVTHFGPTPCHGCRR